MLGTAIIGYQLGKVGRHNIIHNILAHPVMKVLARRSSAWELLPFLRQNIALLRRCILRLSHKIDIFQYSQEITTTSFPIQPTMYKAA